MLQIIAKNTDGERYYLTLLDHQQEELVIEVTPESYAKIDVREVG